MGGRIGIVVAFRGDAKSLECGIFVRGRHRLVGGLVGTVHGFTVGFHGMVAAIVAAHKIELDFHNDGEKQPPSLIRPLGDFA